jgi:molybdopterin molybdotransferase
MPVLTLLGGGRWQPPRRYAVPAAFSLKRRKTGRREFLRGMLSSLDGQLSVKPFPRDGSGLISSLRASDGLIEIGESAQGVNEGQPVSFIPYSEFGLPA